MIYQINKKQNIFNDDIAYVEQWDFSKANLNEENRILAITQVASICYQNPKALGSESLYNRLAAESMGLPSSSFEFVPVLLEDFKNHNFEVWLENLDSSNIKKFGEVINHDNKKYFLTNYRALYNDYEELSKKIISKYNNGWNSPVNETNMNNELINLKETFLNFYNTEEECKIIKEYFKVFLFKVDFPTRSQMVRHRLSWQELSRRYVSGSRVPFEYYLSEKLKDFSAEIGEEDYDANPMKTSIRDLIDYNNEMYDKLLEAGIKPQEARRIIPQAAYTQIWGAFQPKQLENYFNLRLDKHSQWEIQQTAIAMKELIGKPEQEIQEGL